MKKEENEYKYEGEKEKPFPDAERLLCPYAYVEVGQAGCHVDVSCDSKLCNYQCSGDLYGKDGSTTCNRAGDTA